MPDCTPIALWKHSIRMFLWLLVAWAVVSAAAFLVSSALSVLAGPQAHPLWLIVPFFFAMALLPLTVAFHFGRDLRTGDRLGPADAAMAGLGGAGLVVLALLLLHAYLLWSGVDNPDLDGFVSGAIGLLAFIPVMAGVTALGAWWAGRREQARS